MVSSKIPINQLYKLPIVQMSSSLLCTTTVAACYYYRFTVTKTPAMKRGSGSSPEVNFFLNNLVSKCILRIGMLVDLKLTLNLLSPLLTKGLQVISQRLVSQQLTA